MVTGTLRKVGGSVMIAIPPALLDIAELHADMEVGLTVQDGSIVIQSKRRRYSLSELIEQCNPMQPSGDREWVDAPAVGDELL